MAASVAMAQINVIRIDQNATPETRDGIFYSLPRTVVNIHVSVDRVEHFKGPYADFAMRFLGLKNVVEANAVDYRISDLAVTTSSEPDPDQYYFIGIGEKQLKSGLSGLLSLNEAGVILGVFPPGGEPVAGSGPGKPESSDEEVVADVFGELFKYSADVSVFEKVDTIIRKINIDTMTVERQYLKRTMVEKSPEQKAREAADFISKIKESRFALLSGSQEVNYDRQALQYMDEQLAKMEKEYLKLFTGISVHKTITYHYKYIPVASQINTEIPVFKFARAKGVVDLDEPVGKYVTVKVQRVGNTNSVAGWLNKAQTETETKGFAYRIPELARVIVKLDESTQEETQCMVAQLGVVASLPSSKWKVRFHEETGGIRGLDLQ